ncbi:MAG TPA: hypothetical protein V6D35_11840 [Candidatus Sericytochromatia bacterium]|jgi:hypothetical protein
MTPAEIEAVLKVAFIQCETALCPLSDQQKQILLQLVVASVTREALVSSANDDSDGEIGNPLDELTAEQRQALLQFVKEQEKQERPWKIKLLNDWLHDRNSGTVQFIRDSYGPQWLNRIKPVHLAQYFEAETSSESLRLKVGDRIEVSNGLWEWVQDEGPCSREWFTCTVVQLSQRTDTDNSYYSCVIRFDNGGEYEIQGIYQWNRYNWRWSS